MINKETSEKLAPMFEPKYLHSMTGTNLKLITTGGKKTWDLRIVEQYEIVQRKWCRLPDMKTEISEHSSCIANNNLFCFYRSHSSSIIEKLNLNECKEWIVI